jgi:hypothetical protein
MNAPPGRREAARSGAASEEPSQNNQQVKNSTTQPEYGDRRRAFLIAMFMIGAVPHERVVERILAEVEAEA